MVSVSVPPVSRTARLVLHCRSSKVLRRLSVPSNIDSSRCGSNICFRYMDFGTTEIIAQSRLVEEPTKKSS
jgi:hypothetical protein